jgi:hypothetical protein
MKKLTAGNYWKDGLSNGGCCTFVERNFTGGLRRASDQRVPHISLVFGEMWDSATLPPTAFGIPNSSTTQIMVRVSHISQETSEIPGFPVRGFIRDRVCGFH